MSQHAHQVLTELLVLRAQAGQRDAIGLLVRMWHERLLRHARRTTAAEDAALDVMQESWMEICRGLPQIDDPARFGPWAYRIVTRRCARWVNKQQRRRAIERAHFEQADIEQVQAGEHGERTSEADATARSDTADAVRTALRRLPAEQQAILELRYVEGFGIEQIATALGIAAGTVKSRLFHARQHLKAILQQVES
jgi:RNA polymerase sigma-70 factor (ECF subfamily)